MSTNLHDRLVKDFPYFAEINLRIKPKVGPLIPLKLNRAQAYLHKRAEDMKRRTGRVRIIVLKGRQQGLSTYIGGRLYHLTSTIKNTLTFIFAHDGEGSNSLFSMVQTYYNNAALDFRPYLGNSNARELLFPVMQSGYKVGTAGTEGLGRSKTIQNLHWSEVAFSPNANSHARGIIQAVPDMPNTEIFLESTSNGMGDFFHRACVRAITGAEAEEGQEDGGDGFELVFIPWYWQPEYTKPMPQGFELEQPREGQEFTSEQEYFDLFAKDGLTLEHLVWRRSKIKHDFHGDNVSFMREYPFTPEEAFEASSEDCFIKPMLVRKARNTPPVVPTSAPLIMGVDPAREGKDQFKICHRKGRNVTKLHTLPKGRIDQTAQRLAQEINKYKPVRVNIDCGGLGVGVYDILVGNGYGNIVRKVDFGADAIDTDKNYNKRAEMYREARDWLENSPVSISCDDKEADKLQMELAVVKVKKWVNNSELLLIPKEEIKKELKFSPDNADAFVLTFADPVANPDTLKGATPQRMVVADTSWSPFQ